ncbi:1,4-beta-xylanase, partial [Nostoc sp. CHAB 5715]|nr:1,4-beta-xylanase [Nostoc sp. CHAB 5715]
MPYRRKFLTRAGYTTLSALLTMGFLQKDKQKEEHSTNRDVVNYTSINYPLRQLAAAIGKRYGAAISS